MQPYLLPYIGYFQLMKSVDAFVIYDNIQYTKKGWINRNRFLRDGEDVLFSIPLCRDSDYLDVRQRTIASDFDPRKLLNQFRAAYRRAPYFTAGIETLERVLENEQRNLFGFIFDSIRVVCDRLDIGTRIIVSSTLDVDHSLRGKDKVQAICRAMAADTYINPIGGQELYDRTEFSDQGICLQFLRSGNVEYAQLGAPFVPSLSIIDILMFNPSEKIQQFLAEYHELV